MPDQLVEIIRSLPIRLRESLKAQVHAARNYAEASDVDVARDLRTADRTVRNHRREIAARGLSLPPLRGRGQPKKVA